MGYPDTNHIQSLSGNWARDGEKVNMVKKDSAQLFWPSEHRIPVRNDHTDMVKFASQVDDVYQTVVTHMDECVMNIIEYQST
jgi:hypothetical protein